MADTQPAAPAVKTPPPAPPKKPSKTALPAAPQKRCPDGSRKDPETGKCKKMSAAEKAAAMANHYHRSSHEHAELAKDPHIPEHHRKAIEHEGHAHAHMGIHHDAMRRAHLAKGKAIKAAYHKLAADSKAKADAHYDHRDRYLAKDSALGRASAYAGDKLKRIASRVGSLLKRKREHIEADFGALVESQWSLAQGLLEDTLPASM